MLTDFTWDFLIVKVLGVVMEIESADLNKPYEGFIVYPPKDKVPTQTDPTMDEEHIILRTLQNEGAIKILKEDWGKYFPMSYVIEILHPKFDETKKEIIRLSNEKHPPLLKSQSLNKPSKKKMRISIKEILKNEKIIGQEKDLLNFLSSDFKAKSVGKIRVETGTKDCKHLVMRLRKKLKKTEFSIRRLLPAFGEREETNYQLEYSPLQTDQGKIDLDTNVIIY
ncbi:MAG: hypothetical protein ABSE04_01695 [Candidatus Microgenomates bacterium]